MTPQDPISYHFSISILCSLQASPWIQSTLEKKELDKSVNIRRQGLLGITISKTSSKEMSNRIPEKGQSKQLRGRALAWPLCLLCVKLTGKFWLSSFLAISCCYFCAMCACISLHYISQKWQLSKTLYYCNNYEQQGLYLHIFKNMNLPVSFSGPSIRRVSCDKSITY